jgi:hypothetical protein
MGTCSSYIVLEVVLQEKDVTRQLTADTNNAVNLELCYMASIKVTCSHLCRQFVSPIC